MEENFDSRHLISKERLHELAVRNNRIGALYLLLHLLLFALSLSNLYLSVKVGQPLWIGLAILIQAILMASAFGPIHECTHYTAFTSRRLCDFVGTIFGILTPSQKLRNYRYYHLEHHRFTRGARDPEGVRAWSNSRLQSLGLFLMVGALTVPGAVLGSVRIWLVPFRKYQWKAYPWVPKGRRGLVFWENRLFGVYVLCIAFVGWRYNLPFLAAWLVAWSISTTILVFHTSCEHTGLPLEGDIFDRTRSMRSNWLWNFLFWNETYHAEHHAYPAIPFYNLPALRNDLEPYITNMVPGYISTHLNRLKHQPWIASTKTDRK